MRRTADIAWYFRRRTGRKWAYCAIAVACAICTSWAAYAQRHTGATDDPSSDTPAHPKAIASSWSSMAQEPSSDDIAAGSANGSRDETADAQSHTVAPDSLSRLAPPNVGLYLEVVEPASLTRQKPVASLMGVIDSLIGKESRPTLWRDISTAFSGRKTRAGNPQFGGKRLALVAPGPAALHEAVIIMDFGPSERAHVVPDPQFVRRTQRRGRVSVAELTSGWSVGRSGRYAVVAVPGTSRGLFDATINIINRRRVPSLGSSAAFAEAWSRHDPNQAAFLYFSNTSQERSEHDGSLGWIGRWFERGSASLAVVHDALRVHVDFNRAVATAHRRTILNPSMFAPLPQNTVLAWSTSSREDDGELEPDAWQALFGRFRDHVGRASGPIALAGELLSGDLGPAVTLVVSADLDRGSPVPMGALIIECSKPDQVYPRLVHSLSSPDDSESSETHWNAVHTSHLGFEICSMVNKRKQDGSDEDGRFALSVAALDDAIVFATHAKHVRDIIEARTGLAFKLADLNEVRASDALTERSTIFGFGQPALASALLSKWVASLDGSSTQDAAQVSPAGDVRPIGTDDFRLGFEGDSGSIPGAIVVMAVDPEGAAGQRLRAGDRIIGAQGRLLSLNEPGRSLRQLVRQSKSVGRITLRLQRADGLLDVTIPLETYREAQEANRISSLARILEIGQQIRFVLYRVAPTEGDRFEANVYVGFR